MLGTVKYSTSLSPVSSRSLEGERYLNDDERCLQDRRIEIRGDVALHGGIWFARVLVVDDNGHAVGKHGAGQACTRPRRRRVPAPLLA